MAADKKTPLNVAPISSSSMRAAFCSSPMSVAPGPPRGKPRICATATVTTASRFAAAWRCRPDGGGWRSIFAVDPGICRASTSRRSCSISSGIFAALWICSGIAAPSTDGGRFGPSSRLTRGSMSTISPRMRRSSTRPSMSGRARIGRSPTEPQTTSSTSATDWTPLYVAFAAPNNCSGPASTPPTCRGRNDAFHYLCETQ
jgi:hypothetical protein